MRTQKPRRSTLDNDILVLNSIDGYYGKSHVLKNISFSVKEGSLCGLLGRNGAGKSTCISAIMQLVNTPRGTITFRGKTISGYSTEQIAAQGIAWVPQGRRIFKSLTVLENLTLGNTESKSECASSLSEIFKLFPRLQERLAQNAAHLSGGEQQMLAIGRALMLKPKVLLLDEPTEGLAPLIVNELLSAIQGLKSLGLTMILFEQNINKMLKISDEIVILNNGEVSLNGTPQSIAESNTDLNTLLGIF